MIATKQVRQRWFDAKSLETSNPTPPQGDKESAKIATFTITSDQASRDGRAEIELVGHKSDPDRPSASFDRGNFVKSWILKFLGKRGRSVKSKS